MSRIVLALTGVVVLLSALAGSLRAQSIAELHAAEEEIVSLVNKARGSLPPLIVDSRLQTAARKFAKRMADDPGRYLTFYIYHHGDDMQARVTAEGYDGLPWENVHSWASLSPNDVVNHPEVGWMNYRNPTTGRYGHRDNILNPRVTHVGVGVEKTEQSATFPYFFCLILATPPSTPDPAPARDPEYPSYGWGVYVRPIAIENRTGGQLRYKFRHPAQPESMGMVRSHEDETPFTLANNETGHHYVQPETTVAAVEVNGRTVSDSVLVLLDKTHVASVSTTGTPGVSWDFEDLDE